MSSRAMHVIHKICNHCVSKQTSQAFIARGRILKSHQAGRRIHKRYRERYRERENPIKQESSLEAAEDSKRGTVSVSLPSNHMSEVPRKPKQEERTFEDSPDRDATQICESVGPLQGSKSPKSGKEGFGAKKLPFPSVPEMGALSQKIPISPQGSTRKMGFLDSKRPFLGRLEMGVF